MPADGHEIETPCAFPPSFSAAVPGISRAVCQIPLDAAGRLRPGAWVPGADVCGPAPDVCFPAPDVCGPAPVQAASTSSSRLIAVVLTTAVVLTRRRAIGIKGPLFHRKSIPTLAQTSSFPSVRTRQCVRRPTSAVDATGSNHESRYRDREDSPSAPQRRPGRQSRGLRPPGPWA